MIQSLPPSFLAGSLHARHSSRIFASGIRQSCANRFVVKTEISRPSGEGWAPLAAASVAVASADNAASTLAQRNISCARASGANAAAPAGSEAIASSDGGVGLMLSGSAAMADLRDHERRHKTLRVFSAAESHQHGSYRSHSGVFARTR